MLAGSNIMSYESYSNKDEANTDQVEYKDTKDSESNLNCPNNC